MCQRFLMITIGPAIRWTAAGISLLAAFFPSRASAGQPAVAFAAEGRSIALEAEGFDAWHCGYSARVVVGGQEHELSSIAGEVVSSKAIAESEATPQGPAAITSRTIRFPQHGVDLLFRLGRVAGTPAVLMQAGIANAGKEPVQLVSVTPLVAEFSVQGAASDWLAHRAR